MKLLDGEFDMLNKRWSGCPSSLNLCAVQAELENNSGQTTLQLAMTLFCSIRLYEKRLPYVNLLGQNVLHHLMHGTTRRRVYYTKEVLTKRRTSPWLNILSSEKNPGFPMTLPSD
ncbi:hypothetical protein M514_06300, partial [Trichuris suis]